MGKPVPPRSPFIDCPDEDVLPHVAVAKVVPGPVRKFVGLDQVVLGFLVHWVKPRSEVCTLHMGACNWCAEGRAARWDGYITVAELPTWRIMGLHYPKSCYRCAYTVKANKGQLRGMSLTQYRRGTSNGSPLVANAEPATWDRPLPQPPDIRMWLSRLFNCSPAVFGVEGRP
jgi:hypothetical protein